MSISQDKTQSPWYADMGNYFACGIEPVALSKQQKKKFKSDAKYYFWDELFLYKHCADDIMRRCLPDIKVKRVIYQCHSSPYAGMLAQQRCRPKYFRLGSFGPQCSEMYTNG
jgi:hypothetical protein